MAGERQLKKFIHPMLAREVDRPFDDPDWIFEIKWDGYRAIAEKSGDRVLLYSRNGQSFLERYPAVASAVGRIRADAVLDGEIVVLDNKGRSDFQFLQHYAGNPDKPIQYQVFDLLSLQGKDLTHLPLVERKKLLKKIIPPDDVIRYSDHVPTKGKVFFNAAKRKGLEGILAKRADSLYYPGKRTEEWLKIKNHKTLEALIAGYTEPTGARKYIGALILGVPDGKELKYIGHAGGGFNQETLQETYRLLQPLRSPKSPFSETVRTNTPVTWVRPRIVCEVKFSEFTSEGKLRHPIFLRLRTDKPAQQINTVIPGTKPKKSHS